MCKKRLTAIIAVLLAVLFAAMSGEAIVIERLTSWGAAAPNISTRSVPEDDHKRPQGWVSAESTIGHAAAPQSSSVNSCLSL